MLGKRLSKEKGEEMDDLIKLTAREAVKLLKNGEVSPLDLIDAAVERIEEVEKDVNAVPTLCVERAREQARTLMSRKEDDLPPYYLYGLPIVVKDLDDVEGVRTTYGSPIYIDHVPDRSDYMVETLERNGAIVIGKSNTPEFGAGANTFNEVFGVTRNPWNTAMTCGGSSGGSAVALATGEAWLATGSDLGGSLRIPASYCSVVGFRPSPGRVASGPKILAFDTLAVHGPMARNIPDLALMLDAMAGAHPGDPLSFHRPGSSYIDAIEHPIKPRKIAFSLDLNIAPVDPEVREVFNKTVASWKGLGIDMEESCPDLRDAEEVFQVLRAMLFAAHFSPLLKSHRDLLKQDIIWNIEKGLELTPDEIGKAERARSELYQRTAKFFEDYDLLICPTVIAPPFDVNIRYLTEVDGVEFDSYIGWLVLTFAITLTACPAISVPCGFTSSGLPIGLQIIGAPRREDWVLSGAAIFEKAHNIDSLLPINPRTG